MACSSKGLGVCGTVVLFMCTPARADLIEFTASLDGAQAASCSGTGSSGTGSGTFTLDTATGIVSYNVTISGLGSAGTLAHVHGPAAECASATPVYSLPPGSPKIGTSPPLTAKEQAEMIAGLHYVNIHTMDFVGGEIRGQILAPIPTVSTWGLAAMALLVLTAGTIVCARRRVTFA